jgi:alkylation response protein AidB-like acyl-CoA dehydrogenase
MSISPSPVYEQLSARFAPIFNEIKEGAVAREQDRILPFDQIRLLREAGFGRITVPERWGGFGASLPDLFALLMDLGEADSNLPQILRAHFWVVEYLLLTEDEDFRQRHLRSVVEQNAIFGNANHERSSAAVGSLSTRVTAGEAGTLSLTGEKFYSTGSLYSDYIAVTALDDDDNVVLAIVPAHAEGVQLRDDWDGFGQKLTGSGSTHFDAVRISPEDVHISPEQEASYLTAFLQLVLLSSLTGVGRAALHDTVALTRKRTRAYSHASAPRASEDPIVQETIGELAAQAFSAESAVLTAAAVTDRARNAAMAGEPDREAQAEAAEYATVNAQRTAIAAILQVTSGLFEVGGASATSTKLSLDRHWRNARTLASHNPVKYQSRAIGDHLLNGTPLNYSWSTGEQRRGRQPSAAGA